MGQCVSPSRPSSASLHTSGLLQSVAAHLRKAKKVKCCFRQSLTEGANLSQKKACSAAQSQYDEKETCNHPWPVSYYDKSLNFSRANCPFMYGLQEVSGIIRLFQNRYFSSRVKETLAMKSILSWGAGAGWVSPTMNLNR